MAAGLGDCRTSSMQQIDKTSLIAFMLPFVARLSTYVHGNVVTHVKEGGICVYTGWKSDLTAYVELLRSVLSCKILRHNSSRHFNILGDARTIKLDDQFPAMITSPPYPNGTDYSRMFAPENAWIKWIADISKISRAIISCNPLAIVLTGGDPLLSSYLRTAIESLQDKCGIIIDTSGISLNDEHLDLFHDHNVFVRVSLDSEIPRVNDKLRPLRTNTISKRKGSTEAAVSAITRCLDRGIKVGVQTVVSKYNRSDLEMLGDKLYRLGISNWRIMLVAPSKERLSQYHQLRGDDKGQKRYYNHIEKQLQQKHKNWWHQGMAIQLTHNKTPNAVVLVSPDGTFYTESNIP